MSAQNSKKIRFIAYFEPKEESHYLFITGKDIGDWKEPFPLERIENTNLWTIEVEIPVSLNNSSSEYKYFISEATLKKWENDLNFEDGKNREIR